MPSEPAKAAAFTALRRAIRNIPFVQTLGFDVSLEDGKLIGHMPFSDYIIGNPDVPALHGGTIASILHLTAVAELMAAMRSETIPQIFNCTVEYLASPGLKDTHATAILITRTRRFANLRVSAYQDDPSKPVAAATMQFVLV